MQTPSLTCFDLRFIDKKLSIFSLFSLKMQFIDSFNIYFIINNNFNAKRWKEGDIIDEDSGNRVQENKEKAHQQYLLFQYGVKYIDNIVESHSFVSSHLLELLE